MRKGVFCFPIVNLFYNKTSPSPLQGVGKWLFELFNYQLLTIDEVNALGKAFEAGYTLSNTGTVEAIDIKGSRCRIA